MATTDLPQALTQLNQGINELLAAQLTGALDDSQALELESLLARREQALQHWCQELAAAPNLAPEQLQLLQQQIQLLRQEQQQLRSRQGVIQQQLRQDQQQQKANKAYQQHK